MWTIGARYGAALLAVALMSVVIGAVLSVTRIGNLAILFLIPILAAATRLGRGPAIFASIAAFLFYDWFFVEPLHVFTIADPVEWVALVLFLITAVITSELAARERLRARFAIRREREATLLYEALRAIAEPDLDAALRAVADRVRIELNVVAVAIELELAGRTHTAAAGDASAIADATHVLATGGDTAHVGRWIRVVQPSLPGGSRRPVRDASRYEVAIRSDDRTIGNIALIREARHASFAMHERRLLTLLATQIGALAARADLQEATTQAEVLRRTDELKSALLSAVSHDLRTPLASILASAGSLRQTDVRWTEAERDEFAETIEQQADRLSRIVTNLLDLSRIEAGALRPDKQLHDLSTLVDDVVARLAPVTAGHAVITNVADDLPPISMDEVQIDQVLSNLIENSAKYSPPGSAIEVSAHREASDVVVEVSDRGRGIPPSEVEGLFTPFRRSPGVRGVPGFGVGLAVARGLVEAHGGRIWGGNRPEGGARFAFSLPLDDGGPVPAGTAGR